MAEVVNVTNRFEAMNEDEGNGRLDIYSDVFVQYLDSDLFSQLFGHGYNMVSVVLKGPSAHNDFLEVLYDYGIIGFIILSICMFVLQRQPINYTSTDRLILSLTWCHSSFCGHVDS